MSADQIALTNGAARCAYAAGLCVLPPVEDGTKRPQPVNGTWDQFRRERPSADLMRTWYPGRSGIGIVAGAVSGDVEALDFDERETYFAYLEAAEATGLSALIARIEDAYCDDTAGGGVRWLWRCPGIERDQHNQKLARRPKRSDERQHEHDRVKVLIELPDYAIVAPSNGKVHPSGRAYVRRSGDFPTIATISLEDRHALIDLARTFDAMPRPEPREPRAEQPNADGTRPGDDYTARTTWADVLTGWTAVYTRGETTYWRRPGKAFGISATTNHTGTDRLHVFSSSTPFEPETSYSRFGAYAVLEHGGDFAAAAKGLAAQGYGTPKTSPSDSAREAPRTEADRLTEAGAAERFARLHGDDVRFDHRRGRWLLWQGHRWLPDADAAITRLAIDFARTWQRASVEIPDRERREKTFTFASRLERRADMTNMLAIAKALKPIADAGETWDRDPWLLGVENGVVDLRTGILRPGRRADQLTMSADVAFDPDARCPRWERFIAEVFNRRGELIDFVHRAIGYSLTGITTEQCLFLCYGTGANGKGTLAKQIITLLADYGFNMPFSTIELNQRASIPNDVAALVGRRFIVASETNDGTRLNESRVKALTGCDPITARFLNQEFFTFEPVAKFWLAVNHKPIVRDDSHGFWRRLRLIPFTQTFDVDLALTERLSAEAPGILAWAVRGCLAWQRDGLQAPAIVTEATREYERDSDPLAAFLAEACELEPASIVRASELYDHYKRWADRHSLTERERLSSTMFGRKLAERFEKDTDARNCVIYRGLARRDMPA